MGKRHNRHFTREDVQMANKFMKDVQHYQPTREMQIEIMRYPYTTVRITKIKNSANTKCQQGC